MTPWFQHNEHIARHVRKRHQKKASSRGKKRQHLQLGLGGKLLLALLAPRGQTRAVRNKLLEERRRRDTHRLQLCQHRLKSGQLRILHRTTQETREVVAVHQRNVDVRHLRHDPLGQHVEPLVDHGEVQAARDLLVRQLRRHRSLPLLELRHERVGHRRLSLRVHVVPATVLHPVASLRVQVVTQVVLRVELPSTLRLPREQVQAHHVSHHERADPHPELQRRRVNNVRRHTVLLQLHRTLERHHPVRHEPVARVAQDRNLPDLLAERHRRRDRRRRRLRTRHVLQELHHVCGHEEVHAHHVLRTPRRRRDLVDRQVARVRRQHRSRLAHRVELREHLLLHRHVLEHSLDHHVAVLQRREVTAAARDRSTQRLRLRLRQLPLLHPPRKLLPDPLQTLLRQRRVVVDHHHLVPALRARLRDPAPHLPRAHNSDRLQRLRLRRQPRHLPARTLREEHVLHRLRLVARQQRHELLLLHRQPREEVRLTRRRHTPDDRLRRRLSRTQLAPLLAQRRQLRVRRRRGTRAQAPRREVHAAHLRRQLHRSHHHVAVHDAVQHAKLQRLLRVQRRPGAHQVRRPLRTHQTRHPLRSAGARQQAQVHLRQSQARLRRRHPVVRRQRELAPAAQRHAVDRRHHRLRRRLVRVDHLHQVRSLHPRRELRDVSPRAERPVRPRQHNRVHLLVRRRRLQVLVQPHPHTARQRVHRRVVQRHNRNLLPGALPHLVQAASLRHKRSLGLPAHCLVVCVRVWSVCQ
eukprot:Rhum_TRINITY_DN14396_c0_g1::Rhum_TRINITY_DN14396_c0_g1_i1::g.84953::m.84953